MADIYHYFPINAPRKDVFTAVSTPAGLDTWWSKSSSGNPKPDEVYGLDFGPGYQWRAVVSKYVANEVFELTLSDADQDWMNTRVGFSLSESNVKVTMVHFYHTGWLQDNEHYRISSYCWAMYLRILKRYLEFGEQVPYDNRLDV